MVGERRGHPFFGLMTGVPGRFGKIWKKIWTPTFGKTWKTWTPMFWRKTWTPMFWTISGCPGSPGSHWGGWPTVTLSAVESRQLEIELRQGEGPPRCSLWDDGDFEIAVPVLEPLHDGAKCRERFFTGNQICGTDLTLV